MHDNQSVSSNSSGNLIASEPSTGCEEEGPSSPSSPTSSVRSALPQRPSPCMCDAIRRACTYGVQSYRGCVYIPYMCTLRITPARASSHTSRVTARYTMCVHKYASMACLTGRGAMPNAMRVCNAMQCNAMQCNGRQPPIAPNQSQTSPAGQSSACAHNPSL